MGVYAQNSMERVLAVFNKQDFDKYPVITPTSVATVDSMKIANSYFPVAHYDAKKNAALASVGHDIIGFDSVFPYYSIHLEAVALGCNIDWGTKEIMPRITEFRDINQINTLDSHKIINRKPIDELLYTIQILKKKYNNTVPVIGKVIGPLTLAYNLYGTQSVQLEYIVNPNNLKKILESLLEVSIYFAELQFNAGADILTWADHATCDLISCKGYEDLLLPLHIKANKHLKKNGPVILHICGNVGDRLDEIIQTGFECFHIDSRNNISKAVEIFEDNMLLTGGVNNPKTLFYGTTSEIKNEVKDLIKSGIKLISPECAIPCLVPNKNLKAIVTCAHAMHPVV